MKASRRIMSVSPSITLQITARAKQLKSEGLDVIGFGAGEPDFDTPDYIKEAAKRAIDNGITKYTPSNGLLELRKAISRKFKKENNLEYNENQIIVSPGAKFSLFTIFQVLLDPGDTILIPGPYWVSYPEMAKMCEAVPVIIPTTQESQFKITVELLEEYKLSNTKALVLNSPSNPTGSVYTADELKAIADYCVQNNIWIISDEIYEHLIYDGVSHVSCANLSEEIYKKTIIVNGVSKAFSMTGWRIGYVAAPEEVIKKMKLLQDHSTSNACSISQMASLAALTQESDCIDSMREEFQNRRNIMCEQLNAIDKLSCDVPKGAFYVFCDISKTGLSAMDFSKQLLDKKYVAVVPGEGFGCTTHIRLSFATSRENIIEGIKRIAEFVNSL